MEPVLDKATIIRPSYIASVELPPRIGPVNVEDLKADLSDEFSLVSSNLDISQRNSLDSKEHIQVCLRIRPFTATEKENESQDCVSIQDSTSIILKGPKNSMICRLSEKNVGQMVQKFTFSQVFGPETTQEEFFDGTVKQPVQDFLEGHNRLIFTYGVTNAGKTYTFQGSSLFIRGYEHPLSVMTTTSESSTGTTISAATKNIRDSNYLYLFIFSLKINKAFFIK
ncbi:kinesin-like protein KIF20B [Terrapene carolina triunguis]|uniref:kinesin-like protein KIF20B n=1 Tax=Terrapene triunguis TaxID=2587831 RepID=UPI000E77D3DF|nr:kinesin-like protein KIF20B [Terrapene carolina triunguis]